METIIIFVTRENGELTYWGMIDQNEFDFDQLNWCDRENEIKEGIDYTVSIDVSKCDDGYYFEVQEIKEILNGGV